MATTLDSFDFSTRGGGPKYPWTDWLDGRIWKVKRGEDFTVQVDSFRASISAAAKKAGGRARTTAPDKETVIFQFYRLAAAQAA